MIRFYYLLYVIICYQMGIRLINVVILRSIFLWLLEYVIFVIINFDLMEYDLCFFYCEIGFSLDGIFIGSIGNVKSFKNSMYRLVYFYVYIYLR